LVASFLWEKLVAESNILDLITKQVSNARNVNRIAGIEEANNASKAEAIVNDTAKNQEAIGRSQSIVVTATQTANMQAQKIANKAVEAAGGYEALYGMISEMANKNKTLQADLKTYQEEVISTSGFSPIGALKLGIDWSGNRSKVENGIQSLKLMEQASSAIEQRLNQVAQISRNAAQTITQASIEASADIVEREAVSQANIARLEGLKYNTAAIKAIAGMSDRDLDFVLKLNAAQNTEENQAFALREESRRREQFSWQKEQQTAAVQEKLDNKQFAERTVYYINLAETARGMTPSSPQQVKDRMQLKGEAAKELEQLYLKGEYISRTGIPMIGSTPSESSSVLIRNPSLLETLPDERKKALEIIRAATAAVQVERANVASPLNDDKDGKKTREFIDRTAQTLVARQANFVGNNPDNIFFIGDPSSYIGSSRAPGVSSFQNYSLVQKILNPAIENNVPLSDPNIVFGLTIEAVRKGELSSSQAAAEFSNMYKRMSALHRAAVGFDTLGIPVSLNGMGYRVKIGREVVDITNFVEVATAMNREFSKNAYRKIVENRGNAMRNLPGTPK